MKNLWMPTWLAMASLCFLYSFSMPQVQDFNTSTIIIEEDVMYGNSGNAGLDIIGASLLSSEKQHDFSGCNDFECEYNISSVRAGTYTALLHFEDGSNYSQRVVVK